MGLPIVAIFLPLICTTFAQFLNLDSPTFLQPKFEGPEKVICHLEWVPYSNGEFPDENIIAFNTDEIVARLDIFGDRIIGRLSPEDGLAFASRPSDGSVHSSNNYEVLTNPGRCVIKWINSAEGHLPRYFADIDGFGIGKGYFTDVDGNIHNVGGSVVSGEGLFVSFQGKQEISQDCQVLTSTYSFLQGHLYNFTLLNAKDFQHNLIHVIQSETVLKASEGSELNQDIHHSGTVEEIFQISETDLEWKGIDQITVQFASSLGNFHINSTAIEDDNNFQLGVIQTKEIDFTRTIKLAEGKSGLYQICSVAKMLVGQEIQFEATGRFVGQNGMTGEQVKNILEDSGRTVIQTNGQGAFGIIHGTMSGKFVLEKTSAIFIVENPISCHDMLSVAK